MRVSDSIGYHATLRIGAKVFLEVAHVFDYVIGFLLVFRLRCKYLSRNGLESVLVFPVGENHHSCIDQFVTHDCVINHTIKLLKTDFRLTVSFNYTIM